MKILHSSDWHFGNKLCEYDRSDEFDSLIDYTINYINENRIDIFILSGDVFDVGSPSVKAQKQYLQFMNKLAQSCCQHVVIISGNHDSPTFLNLSADILELLDIHIVTSYSANHPEKNVLILKDKSQNTIAIVAALPYLRESYVRSEMGFGIEQEARKQNFKDGIKKAINAVAKVAQEERDRIQEKAEIYIPILGMGHIWVESGATEEYEYYPYKAGEEAKLREPVMPCDVFPLIFDYVALGHLHRAHSVDLKNRCWYSGSPLPMGFDEIQYQREMLLVEINDQGSLTVEPVEVPPFSTMKIVEGESVEDVVSQLKHLVKMSQKDNVEILCSVRCHGMAVRSHVNRVCREVIQDSSVFILGAINVNNVENFVWKESVEMPQLDQMKPVDVFKRLLYFQENMASEMESDLLMCFNELVQDHEFELDKNNKDQK